MSTDNPHVQEIHELCELIEAAVREEGWVVPPHTDPAVLDGYMIFLFRVRLRNSTGGPPHAVVTVRWPSNT